MTFEFSDIPPSDRSLKAVLISGNKSIDYSGERYLLLREELIIKGLYKINYQTRSCSFEEALVVKKILAVGHASHFYLFDTSTNENLLILEMNGYFGHLYYDNNFFYVADANGIYCIDMYGTICWQNTTLGIDGVIIHEFTEDQLLGSGELDPPGGWNDFVLNKLTGIEKI